MNGDSGFEDDNFSELFEKLNKSRESANKFKEYVPSVQIESVNKIQIFHTNMQNEEPEIKELDNRLESNRLKKQQISSNFDLTEECTQIRDELLRQIAELNSKFSCQKLELDSLNHETHTKTENITNAKKRAEAVYNSAQFKYLAYRRLLNIEVDVEPFADDVYLITITFDPETKDCYLQLQFRSDTHFWSVYKINPPITGLEEVSSKLKESQDVVACTQAVCAILLS